MNRQLLLLAVCVSSAGSLASAQQVEVIYSKVALSPTNDIPGCLDLAGMPVASTWRSIDDFAVRPDGSDWVVKGRTGLGTDLENIMVRGSGTIGTMFCQEGRPVQGAAGELYDFFDSPRPVSWDTAGNLGFSCRAKGGSTSDDEKIVRVVGGVHTVLLQQGSPLVGLTDVVANPTGDETLGNSFGSAYLLDSGVVAGTNTPIGNCHSSRYPAILRGNAGFLQSGVSMIGGEVWDNFSIGTIPGHGGSPDGLHYWAIGDTENPNTAVDEIFVVDGAVVCREGTVVPGGTLICDDAFECEMNASGDYLARGDDLAGSDWVIRNGTMLYETGSSVEGGAEAWGDSIGAIAVNSLGDWAVMGSTDNPNPALDYVIVVNGSVVMREGDPVDLNGNGMFDDDVFLGRGANTNAAFAAFDLKLTDDGYLYTIVNLRNGAGSDLNNTAPSFGLPDAFVRLRVVTPAVPYCFGDGSGTPCPCMPVPLVGDADKGCPNSFNAGGGKLTASGLSSISTDTLVLTATTINNGGAVIFQGTNDNGGGLGTAFGDGLRCAAGTVRRMRSHAVTTNTHQYPDPMFGDNAISIRGAVLAPGDRWYQGWYRSGLAHCDPAQNYNLTNGVKITWVL